jgi:hypothetical protein
LGLIISVQFLWIMAPHNTTGLLCFGILAGPADLTENPPPPKSLVPPAELAHLSDHEAIWNKAPQ